MKSLQTISFVVPVRNDAERLRRCLASIAANQFPPSSVHVIVADNGSKDGSAEVAAQAGAVVLVLPGLPVARLRNEAASHATGDVLAFVDADHEVGPGWIAAALQGLGESAAVGIGAMCHAPASGTWVQRAYDRFRQRPACLVEVEWLGAGNLAVTADAFNSVGGFDTTLETCEDVDLCNRLRARGGRLVAEPGMMNIHYGDPATLRALFLGELWRGRDNLRVTLRGPITFRSLPSLLLPVMNLTSIALGAGVAAASGVAWWLLLPPAMLGASTLLRMSRMSRAGTGGILTTLTQNAAVSAVYETARAVALLVRASHSVRRDEHRSPAAS